MKCDELTPIELECNMGKDINGVEHRVPWKAYDIDEVDAAIAELKAEKQTTQYIRSELDDFRQEVYSQLNSLMHRIDNCAEKDRIEFIKFRLENIERNFFHFSNCKPVCEMLENHKSRWIPDSKGGEPNCRR